MSDLRIKNKLSLDDTSVIKCIAICAMVIHHLFAELHPGFGGELRYFSIACKACVSMFLFVSGYGLTVQYSKLMSGFTSETRAAKVVSSIKFMLKRFAKFYLSYWVVFLIAVPIGVLVFGRTFDVAYGAENNTFFELAKDFFGFKGVYSYNATWWFNRLIIILYLMFPLLFWAFRNKIAIAMVVLLVLMWPENLLFFMDYLEPNLQDMLIAFIFGMLCAKYSNAINRLRDRFNPYVVCAVLLGAVIFCGFNRIYPLIPFYYGKVMDPFIAVFTAYSVVCIRRVFSLKSRGALFIGKHATNIYLLHTFILGYFFHDFIYGINQPLLMFLAVMGITLALSIVLEFAKSKFGFYKFQNWVVQKLSVR